MSERPKCANPHCSEGAILMVGRDFWCGACAQKMVKNREDALDEIAKKKLFEETANEMQ